MAESVWTFAVLRAPTGLTRVLGVAEQSERSPAVVLKGLQGRRRGQLRIKWLKRADVGWT